MKKDTLLNSLEVFTIGTSTKHIIWSTQMDKATYDSLTPFSLNQATETYAKLDNNIDFIYYENRAREMRALAIKDSIKVVTKAIKNLFSKVLPALSLSKTHIA